MNRLPICGAAVSTSLRHSTRLGAGSPYLAAALVAVVGCSDDAPLSSSGPNDDQTVIPTFDASAPTDREDVVDSGADVDSDAGSRICSDDGFCHTIVPKGQNLRGVWADDEGIVWAVSVEGNILRWDGAIWKIHQRADVALVAIWGSGPTDVWVVSAVGLLRGQGPNSASLVFSPVTDLPGDDSIPLTSIWGTGPNDVWAVGGLDVDPSSPAVGRVLHYGSSGDDAARWAIDPLSVDDISFHAVWGTKTSVWLHGIQIEGYVSHARVLRRVPGTATWTPIILPNDPNGLIAANMGSDSTVWLCGTGADGEGLWRGTSTDEGETFTWGFVHKKQWDRAVHGLWGSGTDDIWAVGEWGLVARYDGTDWRQAAIRITSSPVGKTFRAISGMKSDDFWVVGDEVALHKTSAGKP